MINDIPTLQNMVKKRDEIIRKKTADINNYIEEIITLKGGKELPEDSDYRECCEQLKAATGEIARLEELYAEEKKLAIQFGTEVDSLTLTIEQLQKQLDQDTELEDKITAVNQPAEDAENLRKLFDEAIYENNALKKWRKKYIEEHKVLEEQLSMCDTAYKELKERNQKIHELSR